MDSTSRNVRTQEPVQSNGSAIRSSKQLSSVFEEGRSAEEVEKDGLEVRAGEPGRGEVGAVENPAFGNHGVVELGSGMVG